MTWLQGPSSQWVDVMKKKRAIHEEIINLVHQQRSNNHVEKVNLLTKYIMLLKSLQDANWNAALAFDRLTYTIYFFVDHYPWCQYVFLVCAYYLLLLAVTLLSHSHERVWREREMLIWMSALGYRCIHEKLNVLLIFD